jgi:hypothetical protein
MSTSPEPAETISACRALFLQQFGTLLQEAALLSSPAIKAIQRGVGIYFDDVVASSRRGGFRAEVNGMTASRLTLVGEDDLELKIRFDNLSARLFQETGGDLWKIHLRFVNLLKRPDLSKALNPVGPNAIVRGLEEMFGAAGATTLDKKLDLLERIESRLQQSLPLLYAEINDYLAGQGAEAVQPGIVSSADVVRKAAGAAATEGTLLSLQQALLSRLPAAMAPPVSMAGSGSAAVSSLMTKASMERLIFRLDELDRQGDYAPTLMPGSSPRLEALIPGLFSDENAGSPQQPKSLSAAELGVPAMAPEGLAIDTLAMIFETIFEHPALPDTLKAVISSLQITMLKLAMKDAVFFTDATHPARLLLDRMGLAMLGLPADVPARHPVCAQLFEIAGQLRSRYAGDISVFDTALSQVDTLIATRNANILRSAESYLPMLEQLDQHDQAALESHLALDKLTERGLPAPISEFIDNHWRRVLPLVLSEYGPNSPQWQAHNSVIEGLLWTFQPKVAPEDRKALAQRLPEILRLLKAGMERIGMTVEAQEAFLDATFALQTQALRTSQATSVVESVDAKEGEAIEARGLKKTPGKPVLGELRLGDQILRTLDFEGSQPAPARPLPCQPGDWLEVGLGDGETCVAYLCHLSPLTQRALLCNPDIGLALAMHPAILDQQCRDGVAHVCSSISLFDAAAGRALRRTTKT